MEKFALNPSLQDKIEFQILFTCFDFNLQKRLSELIAYGFSKKELIEIEDSLKELTNNIIQNFNGILKESNEAIIALEKNREEILLNLKNSSKNHRKMLQSIEKLLNDCKIYGTIPFSRMARIAFISNIMLKSLTKIGKIDKKFEEALMQSISTPLPKFQEDASNYIEQKISRKEFLSKYGHLRPGTYDITALRYDQDERFLRGIKFKARNYSKIELPDLKIDSVFKKHGIMISEKEFYDFLKKSIASREQLKFEFTKNLSEVLEIIAEIGNSLGFSREELANLNIKQIISSKDFARNKIASHWKNLINLTKKQKNMNELIVLPPIIFSEKDFNLIQYYQSNPNFITNKKMISKIELLNHSKKKIPDLDGKIVLVENADPGYDWIFTQNPAGLVTKYGGVASHMAIRCAEINLPAAIGCGDSMFEKLKKSSKIMLDCKNKQILILEHVLDDKFIEERKVLKSLGYIK
jgi:phosphohistidine swiveling domain-containing protein